MKEPIVFVGKIVGELVKWLTTGILVALLVLGITFCCGIIIHGIVVAFKAGYSIWL
jgi:hypothetical protein